MAENVDLFLTAYDAVLKCLVLLTTQRHAVYCLREIKTKEKNKNKIQTNYLIITVVGDKFNDRLIIAALVRTQFTFNKSCSPGNLDISLGHCSFDNILIKLPL